MIPGLGYLPGFGLIRRAMTLALCAAAFWAGQQFADLNQRDRCRDAGGRWDARGFCEGAR